MPLSFDMSPFEPIGGNIVATAPRPHKDYMLLATFQILPAAIDYTQTVSIPGGIHKLSYQYAENRKI